MGILQEISNKLEADIRAAILTQPGKTYEALAAEYKVSRSFIQEIVRRLKVEKGTRGSGTSPAPIPSEVIMDFPELMSAILYND